MIGKSIFTIALAGAFSAVAAPMEFTVRVAKPELVNEGDNHTLVGRLVGSKTVEISARVVGTLWESNVDEGKLVKTGDVLYKIEDTIYKANLQTAKAKELELTARLNQAEIDASRYSKGEASGGVSKADRDRIILQRDVAKAELEVAKANVILAQNDLNYCTIKSPIDGVLGRGKTDVGNNIGPETGTLCDIICSDPIDVIVSIPEPIAVWAFERRELRKDIRKRLIRADGKEIPLDLKVYAFDNKVDDTTGTILVRFRAPNPDCQVMAGGYVKLILNEVFITPRLTIPMSAVVFDGDKRYVYVADKGKAVRRSLQLGEAIGNRIFVQEGLAADESIVTTGVHKIFDGASIKEK